MKVLTVGDVVAKARKSYLVEYYFPTEETGSKVIRMDNWGSVSSVHLESGQCKIVAGTHNLTVKWEPEQECIEVQETRMRISVWIVYEFEKYFSNELDELRETVPAIAIKAMKKYIDEKAAKYVNAKKQIK